MLRNNFYSIITTENLGEERQKARIRLNAAHSIFAGHFPEMPVVPGVCMLQILKEFTEEKVQANLQLAKSPTIKFLSMLQPEKDPEIDLDIEVRPTEAGQYQVKGSLSSASATFLKFKGNFHEQ